MSARRFDDLVTIGHIVRPQGRRGEVLVEVVSDRPDRFPGLRRAFVPAPGGLSREVEITGGWPHKGRFVLKLAGIDSIDDAETLRDVDLRIGDEELAELPAGSYYHHQLRGLTAVDDAGRELGAVADVLETGAAPVLVVRGEAETLIPLVDTFVRRVELGSGRLVVVLPEPVEC